MNQQELGEVDMRITRLFAALSCDSHKDVFTCKLYDGRLVRVDKGWIEKKRNELVSLLNLHFSQELSNLGVSANQFDRAIMYVPGPVIVTFRTDVGVKEVDYYKDIFEKKFKRD